MKHKLDSIKSICFNIFLYIRIRKETEILGNYEKIAPNRSAHTVIN